MGKTRNMALALVMLFVIVMPIRALAQQTDVWQHQKTGGTMYIRGAETAAITQSDGSIALLSIPNGSNSITASIGYYADEFVTALKSSLIDADGSVSSVTIDGKNLSRGEPGEDNFTSYHFILNINDLHLFKGASVWRIETANKTIDFSLKGSRIALDQVEQALNAGKSDDVEAEEMAFETMHLCDELTAHPDDRYAEAPGVAWGDINATAAVEACEFALRMGNDSPRLHYQLGRAYDKAKDARAFDQMHKAANAMRYPVAFNHLGLLYWDGDYTAQNLELARDAFKQGSDLGNINSLYNYGRILIKGGDGGYDLGFGQAMLKGAADADYPLAQRKYGQWAADGTFGSKQPEAAREYLARASDNDDAEAAYLLAQMYLGGQGLDANPALYLDYLKHAARNGHAKAKEELGFD